MDRRNQEILDRYLIPADRPPDLLAMKASPTADTITVTTTEVAAEVTTDEPPATPTSAASQ